MLYREAGQFKSSYAADAAIFPIRQDRIGMVVVLAIAFVGIPLFASPYLFSAILIPFLILALAAVGLNGFEDRPIGTLSGGQFQRALFARLIVQDAPVVLLDEPFRGIDSRTTADLVRLILDWHAQGRTIVAALHDFAQVRAHFPTTLLLAREPVAWGRTDDVLAPANLARATRLSEAWDEDAAICGRDHAGHAHAQDTHTQDTHAQDAHVEQEAAETHAHGHDHHHGHAPHDHGHDHAPRRSVG